MLEIKNWLACLKRKREVIAEITITKIKIVAIFCPPSREKFLQPALNILLVKTSMLKILNYESPLFFVSDYFPLLESDDSFP